MPPDSLTPKFTQDLPILHRRAEIARAIQSHQVIVLCGETGSGKTTQLPQICLSLARNRIAHTQPRRIAARSVAARIADELGVRLGEAVGVKVRFDDRSSSNTRIKLLTDGMLLAETSSDPDLRAYDTIIIDEAHERSLNIDVLLGYLKRLLPRRPDLKLIITSATIDPARFSDFFGGPSLAPVIEVSGRTYPVDIRYHPFADDADDHDQVEVSAVTDAVFELTRPSLPHGDVLVFLPGEREIRLCADALRRDRVDAEILPLLARLTSEEQDRVFRPSTAGKRRVILATNVAETSITVPGIRYVVDTGLVRLSRFDPRARVQRLPIEPISQASANQRSGRCGRVASGICIRLYSERSFNDRPAFTEPEVRRTGLSSVILRMKSLGNDATGLGDIEQFPFLDPPDARAIREGCESLFELGATTSSSTSAPLTNIGRRLARLPIEPRASRIILAGADEENGGALRESLILAAALSIQDPRERPLDRQDAADRAHAIFHHPDSDFLTLLNIWDQFHHERTNTGASDLRDWCRRQFISPSRMREWIDTHRQLADIAEDLDLPFNQIPASPDAIHRALLTGLLGNVCAKEDASSFEYRGARGNVVSIFPGSVLFKKNPKWFVAAEIVETTRLYARTLTRIDPLWVEQLGGHIVTRTILDPHFDRESGTPSAWERVTLNGLVIIPRRRIPLAQLDPAAARTLFIKHALVSGELHGPGGTGVSPVPGSNQCGTGVSPVPGSNQSGTGVSPVQAPELARLLHSLQTVHDSAIALESKLRRRDVLAPTDTLIEWFHTRLPVGVHDSESLARALIANPSLASTLTPSRSCFLRPDIQLPAPADFPDALTLTSHGQPIHTSLHYALAPGKDTDGVTLHLPLLALDALPPHRAAWLVPGLLKDKLHALLKQLPKQHRAPIEAKGDLATLAAECAELMTFAEGSLADAFTEAVEALRSIAIPPTAWPESAVPPHLRLRVQALDDAGKPIDDDRDIEALVKRLTPRFKQARAAADRARFQRDNITTWDFGDLPASAAHASSDAISSTEARHITIIDHTTSVSLSLSADPARAALLTARGVRRLFALACRDEITHRLDALAQWADLTRWHAPLGTTDELRDHLTLIIADRVFIAAQPAIRTQSAFESRLQEQWGRLAKTTIDVADVVARTLEPRSKVAHRLSGGTPRLWVASIADIREHAAYLIPRGFLAHLPWERLREYPRYATAMRERLFHLREDGSGAETAALAVFTPHWKKFTAWVARAMSAQQAADTIDPPPTSVPTQHARKKAPLPQTRRQTTTVNLDAGEWAIQPGNLPAAMETYRWALEEARLALFADPPRTFDPKKLEDLWRAAGV